MLDYNVKEIENKWLKYWEEHNLFKTPDPPKKKFYNLMMFPYPSGDLHMGHCRNYTIGDVLFRFMKRKGYDVLHPIGWDAFGLPAENAAIDRHIHPYQWTIENINISRATIKRLGIGYDWEREVITCEPDYYRWTQWMFLLMYQRGLAYRQEGYVNWCPGCQTVLANEQVQEGSCYRCSSSVEKRRMTQWYFKITAYADRLLKDIEKLRNWPESVKIMQSNWIGRSEGCIIDFPVDGLDIKLRVFTTRPDTIYGVTFMSIAPENLIINKLIEGSPGISSVREYIEKAIKTSEIIRGATEREKDGVFTGRYAINPLSGEKIPIFVADYVLAGYGSGVVMGVPAHDQRDFEFAKKYNLPIKIVIQPPDGRIDVERMDRAFIDPGIMVNSDIFNGLNSIDGIIKVAQHLENKGVGGPSVSYRLRDWLISRQRYWGAPIPMIYCERCGIIPVSVDKLPVLLPKDVKDFMPRGQSPLATVKEFLYTECPQCRGGARRETDTMDTFVCSSWYFLRYLDPRNSREFCRRDYATNWLPIDKYIGGIEHATGHLIYFRFFTKVLYDAGYLPVDEPVDCLFTQGMVLKGGVAMSKSKGNTVPLGPFVEINGSDTSRIAILFAAPPEKDMEWSEEGVTGAQRFLNRVYRIVNDNSESIRNLKFERKSLSNQDEIALYIKLNQTIKKVTEDIESLKFNTALAALMELLNEANKFSEKKPLVFFHTLKSFIHLLSPLTPFIADELWSRVGGKGSLLEEPWPEYDRDYLIGDIQTIVIQVNGRVRSKLEVPVNITEDEIKTRALQDAKILKYIQGKNLKKLIYIPNKLLSIVTE
ncbi:MAG: leucine--tRNA ligase [candidate division WOR-3 bacterium]